MKTDQGSPIRRNTKSIRRVHPVISSTMPTNKNEMNHHILVDENQLQGSQIGMTENVKTSRYGRVLSQRNQQITMNFNTFIRFRFVTFYLKKRQDDFFYRKLLKTLLTFYIR